MPGFGSSVMTFVQAAFPSPFLHLFCSHCVVTIVYVNEAIVHGKFRVLDDYHGAHPPGLDAKCTMCIPWALWSVTVKTSDCGQVELWLIRRIEG